MFMQPIDAQIIELAKEYGITYLRYADDMIFLCQEGIEEGKLEEFRDKIIEIMEGQNLTVHPDKTDLEVGKSEYEIL